MKIRASYYQQFHADFDREAPAEAFGGWKSAELEFAREHMALVVMHAWDSAPSVQWPGWRRCVEYHPRSQQIAEEVFPPLLRAVRASGLTLFHVVGGRREYYQDLPGYQETVKLAGPGPEYPQVAMDPTLRKLREFREREAFPGEANQADVNAGWQKLDFAPSARPLPGEPMAENGHQLAALCRHHGINHLVYVGFAINWCLLMSPGGMVDLERYGVMCSTIPEAVTAVENADTARAEREKKQALWRTALNFGFVFGLEDFLAGLEQAKA